MTSLISVNNPTAQKLKDQYLPPNTTGLQTPWGWDGVWNPLDTWELAKCGAQPESNLSSLALWRFRERMEATEETPLEPRGNSKKETYNWQPGGWFDLEAHLYLCPSPAHIIASILQESWSKGLMSHKAVRTVHVNNTTDSYFFNWMQIASPGLHIPGSIRSLSHGPLMYPVLKSLAGEEDINCEICWLLPNSQTLAAKPIDRMRGNFMQILCAIPWAPRLEMSENVSAPLVNNTKN